MVNEYEVDIVVIFIGPLFISFFLLLFCFVLLCIPLLIEIVLLSYRSSVEVPRKILFKRK